MTRRAVEGIQALIDRTGGPQVQSRVTVDQIYAQMQHEALEFKHPRGGQAKYLETPLYAGYADSMQDFANRLLQARRDADRLWHDTVGKGLQNAVPKYAPVEFGDLRRSAGLETTVGGRVAFIEPPKQRRLSEWELEGKDYLRANRLGYRD